MLNRLSTITLLLLFVFAIIACRLSDSATQTAAVQTDEAIQTAQAQTDLVVQTAIAQTVEALPTVTSLPVPIQTTQPAPTPNYYLFIDDYKVIFKDTAPILSLNATVLDMFYEGDGTKFITLRIITMSADNKINWDLAIVAIAGVTSGLQESSYPLPDTLETLSVSFLDSNSVEKGYLITWWSDVIACSIDQITITQLMERSTVKLP